MDRNQRWATFGSWSAGGGLTAQEQQARGTIGALVLPPEARRGIQTVAGRDLCDDRGAGREPHSAGQTGQGGSQQPAAIRRIQKGDVEACRGGAEPAGGGAQEPKRPPLPPRPAHG